jgi:hypothetical protein
MQRLLRILILPVAAAIIGAACAPPPPGAPIVDPVQQALDAAVAALPTPCPDTITTMVEGQAPPCNPADHTGDGTGLPSQRVDLTMALHGVNAPTFAPETGHCQGNLPSTGYGGQVEGFNLQTMTATCRDIDVRLALSWLIAPATVHA